MAAARPVEASIAVHPAFRALCREAGGVGEMPVELRKRDESPRAFAPAQGVARHAGDQRRGDRPCVHVRAFWRGVGVHCSCRPGAGAPARRLRHLPCSPFGDRARTRPRPVVHRDDRQQNRPPHARRRDRRLRAVGTRRVPIGDHPRARRYALVHDEPGATRSAKSVATRTSRSTSSPTPDAAPVGITSTAHGVWFVEIGAGQIGYISATGEIAEFPLPDRNARPHAIVSDEHGNCWFTEWAANRVGRIDPSGNIDELERPTPNSEPHGITIGSDGAVWVALEIGALARLATPSPPLDPMRVVTLFTTARRQLRTFEHPVLANHKTRRSLPLGEQQPSPWLISLLVGDDTRKRE